MLRLHYVLLYKNVSTLPTNFTVFARTFLHVLLFFIFFIIVFQPKKECNRLWQLKLQCCRGVAMSDIAQKRLIPTKIASTGVPEPF